jgi:hypothetical protein
VFRNVKLDEVMRVKVVDYNRLKANVVIGDRKINLTSVLIQSGKFNSGEREVVYEAPFGISDNTAFSPHSMLVLRFTFKFLSSDASDSIIKKKETSITGVLKKELKSVETTLFGQSGVARLLTELGLPQFEQFQLRVNLYQARDLPAADSDGFSDPYMVVGCCGRTLRFSIQVLCVLLSCPGLSCPAAVRVC